MSQADLVEAFLRHAEARPDHPALIDGKGRVTRYGELARLTAARAKSFRQAGIGQGDVVLVARGVSVDLYAGLIALFRLGAVAMFPEPAAGRPGLAVAVEAARPKAMIAGALGRAIRLVTPALRRLPVLDEPQAAPGHGPFAPGAPDDPALITFTSGSTGRPKGIVRSVGFLRLQHELLGRISRTGPDDVDLISLPVFILSNLAEGATSVLPAGNLRRPARLSGDALAGQIRAHGINRMIAPPAVCAQLTEAAGEFGALKAVFTGGGPVFPNLLKALRAKAPSAAIHAVYGSTEAEPIAHVAFDAITEADWRGMAEGQGLLTGAPIPEARIEIVDHEITVSGPHVNKGYLDPRDDASTKTTRDGVLWHRTGDAGRFDPEGRLWLLGRRDAASGGLFPFAVETAALSWPGVRQAALLADETGAKLFVAGDRLDQADLAARAARLGDIRCEILDAVPMDKRHNSKVDYAALKQRAGA